MVAESIAHYRIALKLAESGVYTTYAAEDPRHEEGTREVVIKALPLDSVGDEDAQKRLTQAVEAAAALDHPGISRVYGVETFGSEALIVREYELGESLSAQLARGRLELDEAIAITIQVARAVEAARANGVLHRNLKPANIFLSRDHGGDWKAKVADFGIRHLLGPSAEISASTPQPALSYRAPEEALRAPADHRSDIWSIGVLFYEMLTGETPFRRSNSAAELLAIIRDRHEPVGTFFPDYPEAIDRILGGCLAKDPNQRYSTARNLADDLERLAAGKPVPVHSPASVSPTPSSDPATPVVKEPARTPSNVGKRLWIAVAAAVLVAGIASAWHFFPAQAPAPRLRKYALTPASFEARRGAPAISPDGRMIVYVSGRGHRGLWIQDLSQDLPRELPDTVGAVNPFWSPDSQWIGFLAGGELKKVSADGESVVSICSADGSDTAFTASWSPDGSKIAFTAGHPGKLFRVAAAGGEPEVLMEPDGQLPGAQFVQYLPAGPGGERELLAGPDEEGSIYVYDVPTGKQTSLGIPAVLAIYSPTGHILFHQTALNRSPLLAAPFSIESMTVTGPPFQVRQSAASPSVSADGTLAYADQGGPWLKQLVWRDRKGSITGVAGRRWSQIRRVMLSVDGSQIGVVAKPSPEANNGFWVHRQVEAGLWTEMVDSQFRSVVLSYWGNRALVSGELDGSNEIFLREWTNAQAGTQDRPVRTDEGGCEVTDWSTDGRHILCNKTQADGTADVWRLTYDVTLGRFNKASLEETSFDERDGVLSPDRRWIAFVSNLSGKHEVYVAPFPASGEAARISSEGGAQPRWGRDSSELFYVSGDALVEVTLQADPVVRVEGRSVLFTDPGLAADPASSERRYDYVRQSDLFLVASPVLAEGGAPATIRLAENWAAEFEKDKRDN